MAWRVRACVRALAYAIVGVHRGDPYGHCALSHLQNIMNNMLTNDNYSIYLPHVWRCCRRCRRLVPRFAFITVRCIRCYSLFISFNKMLLWAYFNTIGYECVVCMMRTHALLSILPWQIVAKVTDRQRAPTNSFSLLFIFRLSATATSSHLSFALSLCLSPSISVRLRRVRCHSSEIILRARSTRFIVSLTFKNSKTSIM